MLKENDKEKTPKEVALEILEMDLLEMAQESLRPRLDSYVDTEPTSEEVSEIERVHGEIVDSIRHFLGLSGGRPLRY